jgi:hypothetical protein
MIKKADFGEQITLTGNTAEIYSLKVGYPVYNMYLYLSGN